MQYDRTHPTRGQKTRQIGGPCSDLENVDGFGPDRLGGEPFPDGCVVPMACDGHIRADSERLDEVEVLVQHLDGAKEAKRARVLVEILCDFAGNALE